MSRRDWFDRLSNLADQARGEGELDIAAFLDDVAVEVLESDVHAPPRLARTVYVAEEDND